MLLNQLLCHFAEHDASHHSHGGRTDTESLTGFHHIIILHGLHSYLLQPITAFLFQFRQFHLATHQRQKMGYHLNTLFLTLSQHMKIVGERREGIIRCSSHDNTALETIRIIADHSVKCIRRSAHHHVPQQMFDVNIHRIRTSCLSFIARSVVSLTEHHREIAHSRFPFLRHGISLWGKGEGVLAFGVSQTFCEIGHSIVQRQTSYREFRLFRLLLLVLCRTLLGSPFILFLLIHFIHVLHFFQPGIHHRVNASLARGKITCNVGNEVERVHFTMHRHFHSSSQRTDDWADGRDNRHSQEWTNCINRFLDTQRQLRQGIVVKLVILRIDFIKCIDESFIVFIRSSRRSLFQLLLSNGSQYVFQTFRHLRDFLTECRVDASHLLLIRETIVAGNHLSHQIAVETADMTEINGKLESQCIAIGFHGFLTVIIHLPPFGDDVGIRNSEIFEIRWNWI